MIRVFTIGLLLAAAGGLSRAAAQAPDGKALYDKHCQKCHGALGTPPQTMKKLFAKIATFDAEFVATHSEDSVVKVLTRGKGQDMKSFKMKRGQSEKVTLAGKQEGELCGACHDGKTSMGGAVVFPVDQCDSCHKN